MLQDDQLKKTQQRLMQAGIRTKDLAFFIIFARFVLPVVLGVAAVVMLYGMDYFPDWGWFRRYMTVAGVLVGSYKAPDIWLKNKVTKRSHAIRKGLPDALDLLVICAEAGLTVDAAFGRVVKGTGQGLSGAGRRVRPDRDRARLPQRAPPGVREPRQPRRSRGRPRRGHDHDPDREIRYAARLARCACCRPNSATSA